MKKLPILLSFLAALLLACGTVSTPASLPTKTGAVPARQDPEPSPTRQNPDPSPPASEGFARVRLHKSGGGFADQLEREVANAALAGLRPFVEFDAEW